jgi:enoyl-CoA hydratase/carnithine racemase
MGAAWLLPRLVGMGRASEILMTGEFLDAEEAGRIGLYNRVVPDERVLTEALELAARLAKGPSGALAVTKRALEDEAVMGLEEALEAEARAQAACMRDPSFREAYEAWREKREPRFG